MNYAIESMDLTDYIQIDRKRNMRQKIPGTEKGCSGITEPLMTYHFHKIYNAVKLCCLCRTFSHFQDFDDSGDFIRTKI